MADLVVRLNLEAEDVELVIDGKVVDTVGTEVLNSWVEALNAKREASNPKPAEPVVEEPVKVEAPVEEKEVEVVPESSETDSSEEVDKPNEE